MRNVILLFGLTLTACGQVNFNEPSVQRTESPADTATAEASSKPAVSMSAKEDAPAEVAPAVDQAQLAKFEIKSASLSLYPGPSGQEPVIELTVRNGTRHQVLAAMFTGTLTREGETKPILQKNFGFSFLEGLKPGEERTVKFGVPFDQWKTVKAVENTQLDVKIKTLLGPNYEPLFGTGPTSPPDGKEPPPPPKGAVAGFPVSS